MKVKRGRGFKRKDRVAFINPIPIKLYEGKVVSVDGAYVMVKVKINGEKVLIDCLMNELELLENPKV